MSKWYLEALENNKYVKEGFFQYYVVMLKIGNDDYIEWEGSIGAVEVADSNGFKQKRYEWALEDSMYHDEALEFAKNKIESS